jgi:hypothetical protein
MVEHKHCLLVICTDLALTLGHYWHIYIALSKTHSFLRPVKNNLQHKCLRAYKASCKSEWFKLQEQITAQRSTR